MSIEDYIISAVIGWLVTKLLDELIALPVVKRFRKRLQKWHKKKPRTNKRHCRGPKRHNRRK